MVLFDDYLKETFENDSELKKEYQKLEPEFSVIQSIIDTRISSVTSLSQQELSKSRNGIEEYQ